jgi:DNA polymerase-4
MHIDLNSCFATIEQQANPLLRYKPMGVAAYDKPSGIIVAASYDAKALGITLGTSVRDGKAIYPGLVIRTPDPPKYREAHRRFREVLARYTSAVTPKSIDEFVVDFTGSPALAQGRTLCSIGYDIKNDIKASLGEYVTVNVGIGSNRFLAKLAAGLHKPDGLDVIDASNLLATYQQLDLLDLPGINTRYKARLFSAGVTSPLDFLAASAQFLVANVFYSKVGYDWYQRLRGHEVDAREFARKSIGHQYALEVKTSDRQHIARLLMKLAEKTGRKLRASSHTASGITLALGYVGGQGWQQSHKTKQPLYATQEIYAAAQALLKPIRFRDKVSHVSLTVYNLAPLNPEQLGLFDDARLKHRALADAADASNNRYGEFTVIPASMANMQNLILDRIAFGDQNRQPES